MTIQLFPVKVAPKMIGAIHLSEDENVDDTLLNVARELGISGYQLCGFVQSTQPEIDKCCPQMFLKSVRGDNMIKISQSLGRGATGCRVDSSALAAAHVEMDKDLDDGADLLILNRFGRCESEGDGLRAIIEKAISKSIPVLIAVRPKYVDQWNEFAGGYSQSIGSSHKAISEWCFQTLSNPAEFHLADVLSTE